jgi:hypothetical protein
VSTGLIALLDDVASLAKVAAASLDDVAAQAGRAGVKAAGVVIDDAAVTPRYVVGFAADRELPIIGRIAWGSLKNKLLYLLPAALLLSALAPSLITPLLMIGGAFLCYEGAEKVFEVFWPHQAHEHEAAVAAAVQDARNLEDEKVRGAIKTDFILSAEIMAITLATMPTNSIWLQGTVLAAVGIGITAVVYGGVALIVKADDAGVALAASDRPVSGLPSLWRHRPGALPSRADHAIGPAVRALGRGLVLGMPIFLKVLSFVGTAAMVWVGGGILVHGLEGYGFTALGHAIHAAAEGAAHALAPVAGLVEWLVTAAGSGLVGLLVGAALIPFVQYVAAPALRLASGRSGRGSVH